MKEGRKIAMIALLAATACFAQNAAPEAHPAAGINWLQSVLEIVNGLILAKGDVFLQDGRYLLGVIFLCKLLWIVIRWQFRSLDGYHFARFDMSTIVAFIIKALLCALLLDNYAVVHRIPSMIAAHLTGQIDVALSRDVMDSINQALFHTQRPAAGSFIASTIYLAVLAALTLLTFGVFLMNAFGFIAVGIFGLFGPLFFPCLLLDSASRLFWRWFDAMFAFAFYRPICAAVVYVFGNVLLGFFQKTFAGNYGLGIWLAALPGLFAVILAFLWAMHRVPMFAETIFGGGAEMGQPWSSCVKRHFDQVSGGARSYIREHLG